MRKIKALNEIAEVARELKAQGRRMVLAHGVFDLLHPGHIRFLEAARKRGDSLLVSLVADGKANLGPGRPVFNQRLRAETLAALSCVDYVTVGNAACVADLIRLVRPDIYVRGSDYAESEFEAREFLQEEAAVLEAGGRVEVIEDLAFSSTRLLNAHFPVHSPEADAYLQGLRQRFTADDVIRWLRAIGELRVLVVGDVIIDEYHFCRPYGKASKSSVIASQFLYGESYPGGALAVANHLAGFCNQVHLVSCLGLQDSQEEFVRASLKPAVSTQFFFRPDAPTVVKRRYVQPFLVNKMFEVSWFNDRPLSADVDAALCRCLKDCASQYDLVVVADFGHGLLGPAAIEVLSKEARFLGVNAQTNSINTGFNVITKYPRADYACIDEEETRMACRDRYGDLEDIIARLARGLACRTMAVTRGERGSVVHQPGSGFMSTPILSDQVLDTMGAGDAFLSVTAPCASLGCPPELIGFIGNAVGALAVQIVGNKEAIEPGPLYRFIRSLLR